MSDIFEGYNWPMANPNHKPFAHQIETAEFLVRNPRSFVLNDLGTGKTLSALWAADFLMWKGAIKRVLVVGPLSTIHSVWANEIKANFPHLKYAVAHGNKPQDRFDAINSNAKIVIMNHDGIKSYNDAVLKGGFDLLIIDELTAFKTVSTARWKAAKKVEKLCKKVGISKPWIQKG